MDPIDVSDAAAVFEGLVKRAAAGEEIVISRDGRPVARLVPLADLEKPRIFGRMRGKIRIAARIEGRDRTGRRRTRADKQ